MDPRVIWRRRAVLALILIVAAALLVASFAGQGGGSVGRGFSSIGDAATGILKPARDLRDWATETWDAKGSNGDLAADRNQLRRANIALLAAVRHARIDAGITKVIEGAGLAALRPVRARVIGAGGARLYDEVVINKGTASGVAPGQPVIAVGGIVGKVEVTTPTTATVALLTRKGLGVQARIRGTKITGGLARTGSNPLDLLLRTSDPKASVRSGAVVATRGTAEGSRFPSIYPRGVSVGRVTRIEQSGTDTQRIHVRPTVDVRGLELVVVLLRRPA